MSDQGFKKILTANDTGESGGHQGGIHIPKGKSELIAFLPQLDSSIKNPDVWIQCVDPSGSIWEFRYVYYNNKLHDIDGTRNEYRVTNMTKYFHSVSATKGNVFYISKAASESFYRVDVNLENQNPLNRAIVPIKLRGWVRAH